MTSPTIDELLLRKVIRGDKGHEVYNKMTNEELTIQEEERKVSRTKPKDKSIDAISQDIDFCILYDVGKAGATYEELKQKFRRDSYNLHDLKKKRTHLLKHVNLIYKKTGSLPVGNARKYIQSAFEQINSIDRDIKIRPVT